MISLHFFPWPSAAAAIISFCDLVSRTEVLFISGITSWKISVRQLLNRWFVFPIRFLCG
jgi:hypothetical protein